MPNRCLTTAAAALCATLACSLAPSLAPAAPSVTPAPSATPPPSTAIPTPTTPPHPPAVWTCFACPAERVWVLQPPAAREVALQSPLAQFYDYAPATGRLLGASHFADRGAGPGNLAVSDLWTTGLDGATAALFTEDVIVKALWLPNGTDIVYVRARPETYELRLLTDDGTDLLLASDVAFTFSPSPDGQRVAFTRESRYGLDVSPGLFVVDIEAGGERRLADLDRAGAGALEDRPLWSPDQRYLFLANFGSPDAGMVLAPSDGDSALELSFAPELAGESWYERPITTALWYPHSLSLLGLTAVGEGHGMGGAGLLVRYNLDPSQGVVVSGAAVAEASDLLAWETPGERAWVLAGRSARPSLMSLELP